VALRVDQRFDRRPVECGLGAGAERPELIDVLLDLPADLGRNLVATEDSAPASPRSSSVAGRTLPMIWRVSWIAVRRNAVARAMPASVFARFRRIP